MDHHLFDMQNKWGKLLDRILAMIIKNVTLKNCYKTLSTEIHYEFYPKSHVHTYKDTILALLV